ncbi:arylformamidase [Myxococcota bacterium]|nr:arylformamidase [Myxococcota bacterium]
MRLWDISPPLSSATAVWPGDTPFSIEGTWHKGPGCPVNVSRITMSTHTGAHADAPLHYETGGRDAAAVSLQAYLGPCRVIYLSPGRARVEASDLDGRVDPASPRLLVRTTPRAVIDRFPATFPTVSPEAIDLLADAGGLLIGVDTPSLDPTDSKTLDAHHAVRRRGLAILEGLVLDDVPEGRYELIALPLRLVGADASPVRAVLRSLPGDPA